MPEDIYLLRIESLVTGYGDKQVLNGVSVDVGGGEVVALIGHNGAGKSTLLKAIFGLLKVWEGKVSLDGEMLTLPNPGKLINAGVSYIPQGNQVFMNLSVKQNLEVAGIHLPSRVRLRKEIDHVLSMFPTLLPRMKQRAGSLSGGEKQILALASAMVISPRFLLADEPSLGLSPQLVSETFRQFRELNRNYGVTILIAEQKVRQVLRIAQRVYVLRNGHVTFSGASNLLDEAKLRNAYL